MQFTSHSNWMMNQQQYVIWSSDMNSEGIAACVFECGWQDKTGRGHKLTTTELRWHPLTTITCTSTSYISWTQTHAINKERALSFWLRFLLTAWKLPWYFPGFHLLLEWQKVNTKRGTVFPFLLEKPKQDLVKKLCIGYHDSYGEGMTSLLFADLHTVFTFVGVNIRTLPTS